MKTRVDIVNYILL